MVKVKFSINSDIKIFLKVINFSKLEVLNFHLSKLKNKAVFHHFLEEKAQYSCIYKHVLRHHR